MQRRAFLGTMAAVALSGAAAPPLRLGMAGLGDRVAKRNTRAGIDSIDQILDKDAFRVRVEDIAAKNVQDEASTLVREFLAAWKRGSIITTVKKSKRCV